MKKKSDENIKKSFQEFIEYIDGDEFYDILPGDGADDYIVSVLLKNLERIFIKNKVGKSERIKTR